MCRIIPQELVGIDKIVERLQRAIRPHTRGERDGSTACRGAEEVEDRFPWPHKNQKHHVAMRPRSKRHLPSLPASKRTQNLNIPQAQRTRACIEDPKHIGMKIRNRCNVERQLERAFYPMHLLCVEEDVAAAASVRSTNWDSARAKTSHTTQASVSSSSASPNELFADGLHYYCIVFDSPWRCHYAIFLTDKTPYGYERQQGIMLVGASHIWWDVNQMMHLNQLIRNQNGNKPSLQEIAVMKVASNQICMHLDKSRSRYFLQLFHYKHNNTSLYDNKTGFGLICFSLVQFGFKYVKDTLL